ncbi:MAG TPA: hypothetical protein VMH02_04320, partial [Verrucomicrobiae bacterium]|nr:hypothetical protein [Verrucomicrobiae bacterium]
MKRARPEIFGGAAFGAMVFAVGFVAGSLRLSLLTPRVGATAAVAIEIPFMVVAAWFVSRWAVRRFRVPATLGARVVMGLVGFSVLQGLELTLAALAFKGTPALIGVVAQFMVATFPVAQRARSVQPTSAERSARLCGDDLIAKPIVSITHAISIHADVEAVWPWLAQMGAGRAGWYSYDLIDNGGRPSVSRVVPDLQHVEVGMLFPALPGAKDAFIVTQAAPPHMLVLAVPSSTRGWMSSWSFTLERRAAGVTRLIVRGRANSDYRLARFPSWLLR